MILVTGSEFCLAVVFDLRVVCLLARQNCSCSACGSECALATCSLFVEDPFVDTHLHLCMRCGTA